jgi:hypothetical protein
VRGKLKAYFAQKRPDLIVPDSAWTTLWVVRITPWGEGEEAVLRYLARYVFRIAITNSRIVGLDQNTVSFRYKHRQSNRWRICTLEGEEFMRRFLQHVLPKGLHKVRYFGLWHPGKRAIASNARLLLNMQRAQRVPAQPLPGTERSGVSDQSTLSAEGLCPNCRLGHPSASSCQSRPKDRDRMPRGPSIVTRACLTRHALLLPVSRSLTKFARKTHPQAPRAPLPRPAPPLHLSPSRPYSSIARTQPSTYKD